MIVIAFFALGLGTALYLMALCIIPLQLITTAHLPDDLGFSGRKNTGGVAIILASFVSIQFVWLNFASHSKYWLPYQISV